MDDGVDGESACSEGDDPGVGFVEVGDEQIDVCLLGPVALRPRRCDVVLDALEGQPAGRVHGIGDGDPLGSVVVAGVAEYRFPEPALLSGVGAFEHDAEKASHGLGHGTTLPEPRPSGSIAGQKILHQSTYAAGMHHYDLVVIGTGSGNSIVDDAFRDLDVAIVEHGSFGGTCVNVGCIPTKMFAYTAEVADAVRAAGTYNLDARLDNVRWSEVQRRVLGRIDGIAEEGERYRIEDSPNVTVHLGHARFTGTRTLRVERTDGSGHDDISADQIVIAAGGRPLVPEPVASSGAPFETSDTVMRMREVPRRLTILGGSYIAAEFAHIFGALGAEVTIIDQADRLLGPQDETVAERFTELARRRYDVRTGREVAEVASTGGGGVRVTLDDGAVLDADTLLVAVGRVPNSDRLDLDAAGVEVRDNGSIIVDGQQRTTAEGVWALGDISTPIQLKHVANREAKVVAHNLCHPDDLWETDHSALPSAIFTSPQIASVGATEQDCRDDGLDYVTGIAAYSDVAFGWAMQDEDGFCKVLAERGTGRLLGAHIMGPNASILIQPLVLAMVCGIDVTTVATRPYWIHPALTEVVENALRAVDL
jgi:mycothione reductase